MSQYANIKSGDKFNGWVLGGNAVRRNAQWQASFICTCGSTFTRTFGNFKRNMKHGCISCSREYVRIRKVTHGEAGTPLYKRYMLMIQRCRPNFKGKKYYYDKGVRVCESWSDTNPEGFTNFKRDVGEGFSEELTLDRKDGKKNYSKSNTRWVTQKEQTRNISNNVYIRYKGHLTLLVVLAEILDVKPNTLMYRKKRGWSDEEIVKGRRS